MTMLKVSLYDLTKSQINYLIGKVLQKEVSLFFPNRYPHAVRINNKNFDPCGNYKTYLEVMLSPEVDNFGTLSSARDATIAMASDGTKIVHSETVNANLLMALYCHYEQMWFFVPENWYDNGDRSVYHETNCNLIKVKEAYVSFILKRYPKAVIVKNTELLALDLHILQRDNEDAEITCNTPYVLFLATPNAKQQKICWGVTDSSISYLS